MASSKYDSFFKGYAEADDLLTPTLASDVFERLECIHSGSLLIDDALSCDGIAKGRLYQYYGPSGSGKSLLAMLAIKEAQKIPGTDQCYIDAEHTFDSIWAQSLGIDTKRVLLIRGDQATQAKRLFDMLIGIPKVDASKNYAGKKTEGLLGRIASGEFNINLIVLDSLGAIIYPVEQTAEAGKVTMGGASARFLSTEMKKLSIEVSKANVPMIVINHKKEGLTMYGPDHTFSGGNAYIHSLSANLYVEKVQRKDALILNGNDESVGATLRVTVEKSKMGPHPRKVEIRVHFGVGIIDRHVEVSSLALKYGLISQSGASYSYGDKKWRGRADLDEHLKSDKNLCKELVSKIQDARYNYLVSSAKEFAETTDETPTESDEITFEVAADVTKKTRGKKKSVEADLDGPAVAICTEDRDV
jgi:recombination protein RecA